MRSSASMPAVCVTDTRRDAMIFVQGYPRTGHAMKWKYYEKFALL